MPGFVPVLLMVASAQVLGGAASWLFVKRFRKDMNRLVFVEAALMLAVSVLLIKEGVEVTALSALSVLAGVAALGVLDKVLPHKHEAGVERICSLVLTAMCFHELPEGIALGSSYLMSSELGFTTAILTALHNFPEGIIISTPYFMKNRMSKGMQAVFLTQVLYVAGALAARAFLVSFSPHLQAMATTFAAGAMLYIIVEEIALVRAGAMKR